MKILSFDITEKKQRFVLHSGEIVTFYDYGVWVCYNPRKDTKLVGRLLTAADRKTYLVFALGQFSENIFRKLLMCLNNFREDVVSDFVLFIRPIEEHR